MGIKRLHTHEDGHVCYAVIPPRDHRIKITKPGLYAINGEVVAAGYIPYTGGWRIYDPETGRKLAEVQREFFERLIQSSQIANLEPEPNCEVSAIQIDTQATLPLRGL